MDKIYKRGMTLIEIIVVLSLMAIISSVALFVSMNNYHGNNFRTVRDSLIASLQHARLQSMNNLCLSTDSSCVTSVSHGVHIEKDENGFILNYVLFQRNTFNPEDELNVFIEVGENITQTVLSTGATEVYFEEFSGNATASNITLRDGTNISTINIGSEGQIFWTN